MNTPVTKNSTMLLLPKAMKYGLFLGVSAFSCIWMMANSDTSNNNFNQFSTLAFLQFLVWTAGLLISLLLYRKQQPNKAISFSHSLIFSIYIVFFSSIIISALLLLSYTQNHDFVLNYTNNKKQFLDFLYENSSIKMDNKAELQAILPTTINELIREVFFNVNFNVGLILGVILSLFVKRKQKAS